MIVWWRFCVSTWASRSSLYASTSYAIWKLQYNPYAHSSLVVQQFWIFLRKFHINEFFFSQMCTVAQFNLIQNLFDYTTNDKWCKCKLAFCSANWISRTNEYTGINKLERMLFMLQQWIHITNSYYIHIGIWYLVISDGKIQFESLQVCDKENENKRTVDFIILIR